MNGNLDTQAIVRMLHSKADQLDAMPPGGVFTVGEIRWVMDDVTDTLVRQANIDMRQAAIDALAEHGLKAKVQAIKAIRLATGVGLKEAKDAVEKYAPEVARKLALEALRVLADANSRTSWQNAAYIDKSSIDNVIRH